MVEMNTGISLIYAQCLMNNEKGDWLACDVSPVTIWITGLSASGKTTMGKRLYDRLNQIGIENVEFLDGEALRKRLDREYGYSVEERLAVLDNTIRIAQEENEKGKIMIVSTISHKRKTRELARQKITKFMEVYLNCSVEICAQRDYKDNYRRALAGELEMFVGVTEPYEESVNIDLELNTATSSIEECSETLFQRTIDFLKSNQNLPYN
jgi:adenylylsulfate kinase